MFDNSKVYVRKNDVLVSYTCKHLTGEWVLNVIDFQTGLPVEGNGEVFTECEHAKKRAYNLGHIVEYKGE